MFEYCVSVIILTFRRSSGIFFLKAGEPAGPKSLRYTLISAFLGWWGIPWGFIYTPMALATNGRGGRDVTAHVMNSISSPPPPPSPDPA